MTEQISSPVEEKLDFAKILPIFVIVLIDLLGLTIIIPLLPLYAAAFGATPLLIGLLGAAYPLMQFLGAPILGRLSDRYGRKPILVISQMGTLVGFILLGLAGSLWVIFLSRLIDGISGANIATAQAAITDSTTPKTRTQGLGLIGAAFGLGFIIGPIIAFVSLELSGNNYAVPAFVAAFFSLLSILLTAFWFKETLPAEKRGQGETRPSFSFHALFQALRHPAVGLLIMLLFAQQLAFGGFEQLLALFTLGRLGLNSSGNAIVFVFVGIIIVAVQGYFVGRWSRRFGDRWVVYAGFALLAIGLLVMAFTPKQPVPWYSQAAMAEELGSQEEGAAVGESGTSSVAVSLPDDDATGWVGLLWLLVAMIPVAVGGAVLQPTINSLITKRVTAVEVGGILGISAAFYSAANAAAPLIGGLIFQELGPTILFIIWGSGMALLLAVALRYLKPEVEGVTP